MQYHKTKSKFLAPVSLRNLSRSLLSLSYFWLIIMYSSTQVQSYRVLFWQESDVSRNRGRETQVSDPLYKSDHKLLFSKIKRKKKKPWSRQLHNLDSSTQRITNFRLMSTKHRESQTWKDWEREHAKNFAPDCGFIRRRRQARSNGRGEWPVNFV